METRGQNTFSTTSVIFVVVKLSGFDTNEKWCKNQGSENRIPAIGNSVSMSIKLYENEDLMKTDTLESLHCAKWLALPSH